MPGPPSRMQIAKSDIVRLFDESSRAVYNKADLAGILSQNRGFWRLSQSTTVNDFIGFLTERSRRCDQGCGHADTSLSGITDPVTGQTVHVGDMDQGVFVDLTEQQANHLSYTTAETLMAYKDKEKARANARSLGGQFHRKSWSHASGAKDLS